MTDNRYCLRPHCDEGEEVTETSPRNIMNRILGIHEEIVRSQMRIDALLAEREAYMEEIS